MLDFNSHARKGHGTTRNRRPPLDNVFQFTRRQGRDTLHLIIYIAQVHYNSHAHTGRDVIILSLFLVFINFNSHATRGVAEVTVKSFSPLNDTFQFTRPHARARYCLSSKSSNFLIFQFTHPRRRDYCVFVQNSILTIQLI